MGRLPLVLLSLLVVPFALAQEPRPTREGGAPVDENEPFYPSYVDVEPLCPGGSSSFEPREMSLLSAGGEQEIVIPRPHEDRDEAMGFQYDSTHALMRFATRGADGAQTRAALFRLEGLVEFSDADGDGVLGARDLVHQVIRVADDEEALRALPPVGDPARPEEPAAQGEPVSAHQTPVPPQYLPHVARDWRSPCGIQLAWTYFLSLDADGFQRKLDAKDPAAFDDEPRLRLSFTHVGAPYDADGLPRVPERVKIDIGIERFPYMRPDSLVAARGWLVSYGEPFVRSATLLRAADGAGFSWAPIAFVDGVWLPVCVEAVPTAVPDWPLPGWLEGATSAYEVSLAYPRGASIVHDPEFGIHAPAAEESRALTQETPLSWPAVLAAVGIAALLARRERLP